MANKVALVTGGASGLGKAIAGRLVAEGARVIISDLQSDLGLVSAGELGAEFRYQDVCEEAHWADVMRWTAQRYGGLHILVNNAGILGSMTAVSPETTRLEEWRRIFAVNVESIFLGCRAAIPLMKQSNGGSIINMSSVAGLLATPYATAYGASKAAVRQLTKSVAQHCAEQALAIRCNSLHPGDVRTPLWDSHARQVAAQRGISFEDFLAEQESMIPLGGLTRPEDVAAAAAFLASEDARHVTGAKIIVDGGIIHCDTYQLTTANRRHR